MIRLRCEGKEPVYAELGGQPTGYQLTFGPDRDADNSGWQHGDTPSAQASFVVSAEAAEAYSIGDELEVGGRAVPADGVEREYTLTGDGTGEALPPADDSGTLHESGSDGTPVTPEPDASATATTRKAKA